MERLISMNKEEKIKEAYGEYWAFVKEYVDEKGWCKKRKKVNFEFIKTNIEIQEHQYHHYYWRPNSLQGIENNNGWVKIESEDDLPKEKELFRFIPCNNFDDEFIGWVDKEIGEVLFIDFKHYKLNKDSIRYFSETNAWLTSQITHYQPLSNTINPPLY